MRKRGAVGYDRQLPTLGSVGGWEASFREMSKEPGRGGAQKVCTKISDSISRVLVLLLLVRCVCVCVCVSVPREGQEGSKGEPKAGELQRKRERPRDARW